MTDQPIIPSSTTPPSGTSATPSTDGGSTTHATGSVSGTAVTANATDTNTVASASTTTTSTTMNTSNKTTSSTIKNRETEMKKDDDDEKEKETLGSTKSSSSKTMSKIMEPEAEAVLEYLRKRGLGTAALELQKHLDSTKTTTTDEPPSKKAKKTLDNGGVGTSTDESNTKEGKNDDNDQKKGDKNKNKNDNSQNEKDVIEMMDIDEKEIQRSIQEAHENKSVLNLATGSGGGGIGYDLDTAAEILIWNTAKITKQNNNNTDSGSKSDIVHIQSGKRKDAENESEKGSEKKNKSQEDDNRKDKDPENNKEQWQQNEATRYVRAFTALQTWILTLPNDDNNGHNNNKYNNNTSHASIETVLHHAKANAGLIDDSTTTSNNNNANDNRTESNNNGNNDTNGKDDDGIDRDENGDKDEKDTKNSRTQGNKTQPHVIPTTSNTTAAASIVNKTSSLTPQSIKPELLSLSFPLLIHTYCNLLQSGLEDTAHALLSTYRHIHEPFHPEEFLDLDKCTKQADMKKLNEMIRGYNDSLSKAKTIKRAKEKLKIEQERQKSSSISTQQQQPDIMKQMDVLDKKYKEVIEYYTECQRQLKVYPFLKRARSVKWHIHLSALTFQMLVRFFHSGDEGGVELLPMSGILQSHCHLVVENRSPTPYVPGFILEDMVLMDGGDKNGKDANDNNNNGNTALNVIQSDDASGNSTTADQVDDVRWAAPVDIHSRLLESGEDISNLNSILKKSERLPFPNYYLKSQYVTIEDYENDKKRVEFNRAILTNGFRRLEALEAKREYEVGVRLKYGSNVDKETSTIGNPMEPSIMFSTICGTSNKSKNRKQKGKHFPLNESSIDLTCAKLCLPDGRKVAAGCTDSAVRIWSMRSWNSYSGKSTVDDSGGVLSPRESTIVLMGHKKGLPVYSIDWNRDGRTLLSAGGDGSIRLWDSKAVGPFGKLASVTRRSNKNSASKKISKMIHTEASTHVPGAKPESMVERNGTALACYRGHAKSTPVWSVAMAPSGYYFASAGSDSTARLWCTDRPTPVRIFMGHYSQNVNCVSWHPNCNYIFSGSDDKTIRMWDVHSGRSVRILSGCKFGVNQVKISPSGQYVAGADYGGTVSIWDIRNGRKLDEFQHLNKDTGLSPVIHTMSYSPCGTTIATGGEDCSIRIWDARGIGDNTFNPEYAASIGLGANLNSSTSIMATNSRYDQSRGSRIDPVKTFYTSGSMILDLEYTKRNLLLSVGKYTPVF